MSNKKPVENSLVEIKDQKGVELGVEHLIAKNMSLLPNSASVERIKASAGFYVANNKNLMELTPENKLQMLFGILKEAMVGCEAGVDYDIIPFKGKPTIIRKKEGWFKIIDLVKPSEIIRFTCNVITEGDEYNFNPVTEELTHELGGEKHQEYKNILGAYAYIKFQNGLEKTVFMSKSDLDKIKDKSPSGQTEYSPWNSFALKMVKTKVTKELAKELFTLFSGRVNTAIARAIESDEIPVKSVDEKGNVTDDDSIYDGNFDEEVVELEEKEVDINEL